mgnify:CR=1 FL=1
MLRSVSFSLSSLAGPLLLAFALLLWTGCGQGDGSEEPTYSVGDPISDASVAVFVSSSYGTDTLSAQRFQQQLSFVEQRTSPTEREDLNMHREVVKQYVQFHVLRGKAQEESEPPTVDSAQIASRLASLRQRFQSQRQDPNQTLEDYVAAQGITMDSLRQSLRQQIIRQAEQQEMQRIQQELAQSASSPSADELQQYSEENARIGAQHILLQIEEGAPQSVEDSIRQRAQVLLDSAKQADVDFAALARRHSEGPSASQGGNLGLFGRGEMVKPFSDAAYTLSDSGDVYDEPVRTQFGYHVIRLTNPGEPLDTTQARRQMMQERRRDAIESGLDDMMKGVTVRLNPDVVDAGLLDAPDAS